MDILKIIGRQNELFERDISLFGDELSDMISRNRFLVIGGAGSIGLAVTREIFSRNPLALHVVDINENNLVELVRDLRSSLGYITGDFRTFAIDCGSPDFAALMDFSSGYDYVFNLSALKHVRSERDPFTLMRLIRVNIINTLKTLELAQKYSVKKYFCVSTDKAANPVNMMGASKRIMEMFLMRESNSTDIATARFANVAFSDGSLLHGFNKRFAKMQPLSAPDDVRRYFLTPKESGELCLMACLLGENRDIFFPKLSEELQLETFSRIAERYIYDRGFQPFRCATEQEARDRAEDLIARKHWPCYFFESDTTGEKDFEEFYTSNEVLDFDRFSAVGVIKNQPNFNAEILDEFLATIAEIEARGIREKKPIVDLFNRVIPDFNHKETGKYLDGRM